MAEAPITDWESTSNWSPEQPPSDDVAPSVPVPATTETPPATEPSPESTEPPETRDVHGRFQRGHRARSHAASPEDIPRISKLTSRAKAAEEERDRIKTELETLKRTPPAATPAGATEVRATETRREPAPPALEVPLTRAKPMEEQIGTTYKTYADFVEDLADWKSEQREARRDAERAVATMQAEFTARHTAYQGHRAVFVAAHPDYPALMTSVAHIGVPSVMSDAILRSDQPQEIEYWLASHPEDFHALAQEATTLPHTPEVARMVQRVLESKLTNGASALRPPSRELAGTTGSAAPRVTPSPRPPNPVRTGAQPPSEDVGPGDDHTFEDHEKRYLPKRRRRW